MPERITAQITQTQVAEGFYEVKDGVLTMTYSNGEPVKVFDQPVTHILRPEDNPRSIAAVLTRDIRKKLRNDQVDGFGAPIDYASEGWH